MGACSPLKAEWGDPVLPNRSRQTKWYISTTTYNTVAVIRKGNVGDPREFCKDCVIKIDQIYLSVDHF